MLDRRRPYPEDMYRWYKEQAALPFKVRLPFCSFSESSKFRIGLIVICLIPLLVILLPIQYLTWRRKRARLIAQMEEEASRMTNYKVGRIYSS